MLPMITFENRTGTNGNIHVIITTDGSVNCFPCGPLGVHRIPAPSAPGQFEVRGDGYHRIFRFTRADVVSPVAATDEDLELAITDILNCCTCT